MPLPFRVVSFNIRYGTAPDGRNAWPYRRDLVAHLLRMAAPDVLGLQECLPEQADFLRPLLPEFDFVGAGRDNGIHGEMVPILWRRDRFVLLQSGHQWLSETPHLPGSKSWGTYLPRMLTWAVLQPTQVGTPPIWFLNAHFDHEIAEARRHSATILRRWFDALANTLPIVALGDFNAGPSSPELGPLFVGSPVTRPRDTLEMAEVGTFHDFSGNPNMARIDWILIGGPLHTRYAGVDTTHDGDRWPSDHFPVIADLEL